MPFSVELTNESIRELEELRRRHQRATEELQTTGDTAVTRMLAFVTHELGERWEANAPKLTGTLSLATRERVFDDTGKVFIDPTVENPVYGGYPVVYGAVVHSRNAWVSDIMANDAQGILIEGNTKLFHEMDGIYS